MQIDPTAERQRLAELYRQMGEIELQQLAADIADLTPLAQDAINSELQSRGLDKPSPNHSESQFKAPVSKEKFPSDSAEKEEADPDEPHDYTWKTPLCECEDFDQIWQLREVLKRAGIDTWVDGNCSRYASRCASTKILVAADQLDQAKEIASQPIPQEIIEEYKALDEDDSEYILPTCPSCKAADPILESADPVNSWFCENCGHQWSDAEATAETTTDAPAAKG